MLRILLIVALMAVSGDLLAKSPGEKMVPISGTLSGFLLGIDPDVSRCNPPPEKCAWGVVSFAGGGTLSHLGKSELYAEHCSYGVEMDGPDGPFCMGDGTYSEGLIITTAANGDVLLGTYENGVSTAPPFAEFMDEVSFVDGGSGRFKFASGGGVERGSVDFTQFPPPFTIQVKGEIAYKRK